MICPRCKRKAVGWLLKRPDICSPKGWVNCLRDPRNIQQPNEKANPNKETT